MNILAHPFAGNSFTSSFFLDAEWVLGQLRQVSTA